MVEALCDDYMRDARAGKVADDAQTIFHEVWKEQERKGPLWVRFFENMVKVAGIRAIADNHLEPVVNLSHAQWARDLVKWCVETMVHDVRRHVADGYYQHLAVHNVLALAVFR